MGVSNTYTFLVCQTLKKVDSLIKQNCYFPVKKSVGELLTDTVMEFSIMLCLKNVILQPFQDLAQRFCLLSQSIQQARIESKLDNEC